MFKVIHISDLHLENEKTTNGKNNIINALALDFQNIVDENTILCFTGDLINKGGIKSENGKSFQDIHIHIMNLKGWLRGIHHHCSKERLQGYFDEYHLMHNRRSNMDTIFDSLIKKMVLNNPIRLQSVN